MAMPGYKYYPKFSLKMTTKNLIEKDSYVLAYNGCLISVQRHDYVYRSYIKTPFFGCFLFGKDIDELVEESKLKIYQICSYQNSCASGVVKVNFEHKYLNILALNEAGYAEKDDFFHILEREFFRRYSEREQQGDLLPGGGEGVIFEKITPRHYFFKCSNNVTE